eukprot:11693756-Ditylum_brightwellii.AAC.1
MACTPEQTTQMELLKRLKFPDSVSKAIVNQGFVGLRKLKELRGTGVANLCKIIRKPGGTKSSESSSRSTADYELSVLMLAENNLKLACHFIKHKIERLTSLDKFIYNFKGKEGIPLECVVRTTTAVPAEADDPESNYDTPADEIAKRVPHTHKEGGEDKPHPIYVISNQAIWKIIHHMCKSHPGAMVIAKPYQRKKDGRGAYTALYHHYLGTNAINGLVTATEADLDLQKYK